VRGRWDLDGAGSGTTVYQDGNVYQRADGIGGDYTERFPKTFRSVNVKSTNTQYAFANIYETGNYKIDTFIANADDTSQFTLNFFYFDENDVLTTYAIDNGASVRSVGGVIYPTFMVRAKSVGIGGMSLQGSTSAADNTAKITTIITYMPGDDQIFDQNLRIR
jgi:hypothetical protein